MSNYDLILCPKGKVLDIRHNTTYCLLPFFTIAFLLLKKNYKNKNIGGNSND